MMILETKEIVFTAQPMETVGNFINELLNLRDKTNISHNGCVIVGLHNDRRMVIDKDTTHSQCFDQFEGYNKEI